MNIGGGMRVRRFLPKPRRRLIGAWCFVDAFSSTESQMSIPSHPHCGLQTVSWLLEGRNDHRDSLGNHAENGPSDLAIMTAGHGIAHAEATPPDYRGPSRGIQLWVALPDAHRNVEPAFALHSNLPLRQVDSASVIDVIGNGSPAHTFTPLILQEVRVPAGGRVRLPLDPAHENAILPMVGDLEIEGNVWSADALAYLGTGRTVVHLAASTDVIALVLGGEPLGEQVLMWWNFVARTWGEMRSARDAWAAEERFGEVAGPRLAAPRLPQEPGPA